MKVIVGGTIPEDLMRGVKDFADDVEDSVEHVDPDSHPAVVTVIGDLDSGLAHLLKALSKVMRTFGIGKGVRDDGAY